MLPFAHKVSGAKLIHRTSPLATRLFVLAELAVLTGDTFLFDENDGDHVFLDVGIVSMDGLF